MASSGQLRVSSRIAERVEWSKRASEAEMLSGAERPRIRSLTMNKAWGGHNATKVSSAGCA
jgi:hypothetical protein